MTRVSNIYESMLAFGLSLSSDDPAFDNGSPLNFMLYVNIHICIYIYI